MAKSLSSPTPKVPVGGKGTGAIQKNASNGRGMKQVKGTTKAPFDGKQWPSKNPSGK